MNTKPILYQPSMIRAIQREIDRPGTGKTQTRRTTGLDDVNGENYPAGEWALSRWVDLSTPLFVHADGCRIAHPRCPYGQPGDLLWVRETYQVHGVYTDCVVVRYRANERNSWTEQHQRFPRERATNAKQLWDETRWRPSIHMPRWASRYTLLLTNVRVERVQAISEDDARAEGAPTGESGPTVHHHDGEECWDDNREWFADLWDSIHGPDAWVNNDWVWVLEFQPIAANVDDVLADPARYGIAQEATA